MSDGDSTTIYAIDNSRPPQTWVSEWVLVNGVRAVGSDVPHGFGQVSKGDFDEARRQQQNAAQRARESDLYSQSDERVARRQALVDSGMTEEQALLLIPEP